MESWSADQKFPNQIKILGPGKNVCPLKLLHFCFSTLAPTPCPPGYYSSVGWIHCLPCKHGYRCKEGSTTDSPPEGNETIQNFFSLESQYDYP